MGFLKKKPSLRLPNDLSRSSSKASVTGPAACTSPAISTQSAPVRSFKDEERDDVIMSNNGNNSGPFTEAESRVIGATAGASKVGTAGPGQPRVSGTPTSKKPSTSKATKSATAKEPSGRATPSSSKSKTKKKSTTSSGVAADKKKASERKSRSERPSTPATAADGKRTKSSTNKTPVALGIKKAPGSDKKKSTRAPSRSASRRRGRSNTPTTPTDATSGSKSSSSSKTKSSKADAGKAKSKLKTKKASSSGKVRSMSKEKKKSSGAASVAKSQTSKVSEAAPRITNKKMSNKVASAGKSSNSKMSSRMKAKSPLKSRPSGAPTSAKRTGRSSLRKRLQDYSDDESSCCSSSDDGSYTDYTNDSHSHSSYYTETDYDESTMYTDASGSFVSIGYNTTQDSDDRGRMRHGRSRGGRRNRSRSVSSAEFTDEDGDQGVEISMNSHSCGSSFDSILGKDNKNLAKMAGDLAIKNSQKDKDDSPVAQAKSVAELDAANVHDGGETTDVDEGDYTDTDTKRDDDTYTDTDTVHDDDDEPSSKTDATSKSGLSDFMKKMEGFVAKTPEHQLVVQVMDHGNVEKLELQELAYIPKPNKPDEIVIKVDCSTITLQDCMIRRGKWYEMQRLPFIPGSDFVGTIFSLGDEAVKNSTFQVGDKVAAVIPSGGNAKYITLPYHSIIRVPNEADSVVALCLSSTYVPAREALDLARKLNTPLTGANVLVIGGNGPSGLATIELALLEGATVFTTADERHHEYLTSLGAKCFPIDPNKWLPTIQGKMDVVLDSVCLDGYESSSLALNSAGTLVCTGMSAVYTQGQIRAFGMRDVRDYKAAYCRMRAKYLLNNTVYYDRMERYDTAPNEYAQHFRYLCHLATKDSIKPLVSSRSPLNLVASNQKAIEHGDTTYGVCVCMPWATKGDEVATPGC